MADDAAAPVIRLNINVKDSEVRLSLFPVAASKPDMLLVVGETMFQTPPPPPPPDSDTPPPIRARPRPVPDDGCVS